LAPVALVACTDWAAVEKDRACIVDCGRKLP